MNNYPNKNHNVAIMQPTFLPWVGYFALLDHVDLLILLDDVQFDKRSWQQRNRIKTAQGPQWLSVPVLTKGLRNQSIMDAQVQDANRFCEMALKSIQHAYGKAPYYEAVCTAIEPAFIASRHGLCALNIALIEALAGLLDISTRVVKSSQTPVSSAKALRLADLCKNYNATNYISPPGSRSYLEGDRELCQAGVNLLYFQYDHPIWPQLHGESLQHISALDLVMNALPHSRDIMRSGMKVL